MDMAWVINLSAHSRHIQVYLCLTGECQKWGHIFLPMLAPNLFWIVFTEKVIPKQVWGNLQQEQLIPRRWVNVQLGMGMNHSEPFKPKAAGIIKQGIKWLQAISISAFSFLMFFSGSRKQVFLVERAREQKEIQMAWSHLNLCFLIFTNCHEPPQTIFMDVPGGSFVCEPRTDQRS